MADSTIVLQRNAKYRTRVKSGCATCRTRKVKCDEKKPWCQNCVDTGRTCDGYESPFRYSNFRCINNDHGRNSKSGASALNATASLDARLLNLYFSTKTMFKVELGCDEEARQILQASATDQSVRHAVSSLKALREDLEMSGHSLATGVWRTPNHAQGLQQYCKALRGLASSLASPGVDGSKSALHCCQIFISIEQIRGNYVTMAQHIIQGLRIMHEHGARPSLGVTNRLVPAHHDPQPFLDVFIIKLFAAPCKFTESSTAANMNRSAMPVPSILPPRRVGEIRSFRTIAPDMRVELVRIAALTLEFLSKVSEVKSVTNAIRLRSEKESLLASLDSWLIDLEFVIAEVGPSSPGPVATSFLRFFHRILIIVLLGALDSSSGSYVKLQTESDQLQVIADDVTKRVKSYMTYIDSRSRGRETSYVDYH